MSITPSAKLYRKTPPGRASQNKWRKKPDVRERIRAYHRERSRQRRMWLNGYKLMRGCTDCGYRTHHVALEFDHRPGEIKVFTISMDKGKRAVAALWTEIQKCDVRCSNCHRVKTYERAGWTGH